MFLSVDMIDWGNLRDQIFPRTGFAPSAAKARACTVPPDALLGAEAEATEPRAARRFAAGFSTSSQRTRATEVAHTR